MRSPRVWYGIAPEVKQYLSSCGLRAYLALKQNLKADHYSSFSAEFRGPGVHHNYEDSDSGYEMDAEKQGKSFGVGGYRGRIIFLGDGTEVLTDSDDTEMFDNADEDKDLESQVSKNNSTSTEKETNSSSSTSNAFTKADAKATESKEKSESKSTPTEVNKIVTVAATEQQEDEEDSESETTTFSETKE